MKASRVLGAAVALAFAIAALSGCTTRVVTSGGTTPLNTVTASGTGRTVAAPDVAEMYFGVTARATDAGAALEQASTAAEKIVSAVKSAGVAAEDVQTANVSVYPLQDSRGDEVVITGYQASIQVRAKVRDIEKLGAVISAANEAGANEISGPSFMLADDSDARKEAIKLAVEDAKKRAEAMADAAGKSVGAILSVSESNVSLPVYSRTGVAEDMAAGKVPIEAGQLDITADVTVTFELE